MNYDAIWVFFPFFSVLLVTSKLVTLSSRVQMGSQRHFVCALGVIVDESQSESQT